jgi:tetratricopeptide (TPR) repeat protein/predicted aspartyl protease
MKTARRCLALSLLLIASLSPSPLWACQLGRLAVLHVTMDGARPLVEVKFNGTDARMVLDSGAFYSMISAPNAAQFKLRVTEAPGELRVTGVDGYSSEVGMATVKQFTMADSTFPNVEFLVGGSDAGDGVVGMLGQNVLGIADVDYDLANGQVRLMRPHDCRKTDMAYWSTPQLAYSVMEIRHLDDVAKHTVGTAYLNGAKVQVLFDTGAYRSLLGLRAAARAGIKPGDDGVSPAGQISGVGKRQVSTWIARFASFKIGEEEIRNTRLRFGDLDLEGVDMLLGADFFLSHHIYVSNDQQKLYFSYNGGPVFNLDSSHQAATAAAAQPAAAQPAVAAEPAAVAGANVVPGATENLDAAAYERRGNAAAARHDYAHALADLTRACELEPKVASHFLHRGEVLEYSDQKPRALEDFNLALQLKPDSVDALLARAFLRLGAKDSDEATRAQATADLQAADRLLPREADQHRLIAAGFMQQDQFAAAIAQLDLWLDVFRDDVKRGSELNERCWARALWGQELERAEADCSAALKLRAKQSPEYAAVLDSRGLVRLRRGNYRGAIADYDQALSRRPHLAWSLYGRGIAKLRLGQNDAGQADLAAAHVESQDIAAYAAKYGVAP